MVITYKAQKALFSQIDQTYFIIPSQKYIWSAIYVHTWRQHIATLNQDQNLDIRIIYLASVIVIGPLNNHGNVLFGEKIYKIIAKSIIIKIIHVCIHTFYIWQKSDQKKILELFKNTLMHFTKLQVLFKFWWYTCAFVPNFEKPSVIIFFS